jgi:hypothetical protein
MVQGRTFPGWRDFERALASVLQGQALEQKAIFDVIVPVRDGLPYGLSCKTKEEQAGFVYMEMANSPAKFMARLNAMGIDAATEPEAAGAAVVELISEWHREVAARIDVDRSSYVMLTHDRTYTWWRLFWYALEFPDPRALTWIISNSGRCITGVLEGRKIWDLYLWSGGQLKYYPPFEWARWASEPFLLEEPPIETPAEKAARYWPRHWRG